MPLTSSDRVRIIKEVSQRLAVEEWPLIDVTLTEFGLPVTDRWDGNRDSYIIKMLSGAASEALIDLGLHVGVSIEGIDRGVDPPFWQDDMFKVFLSHLATERQMAGEIKAAGLGYGLTFFVAHNDIEPTTEWQTQIETALATCDALVALLHPGFHESKWTDQEVGFAMGRGVPTFAIRFGQDPYGFIGRFQAFNGSGKSAEEIVGDLFNSYRKNKQAERKMAQVMLTQFEDSGSFASARRWVAWLEELDVWEDSFSARLESAVKNNAQVSGSWGVPDRVKALVKKHDKT